jgi:anaerobic ribonucleoside-triphosphate reductase
MSPIKIQRQECIVYSRVVGWMTPVQNWNKGKKAEWEMRKTFELNESTLTSD